MLPSLIISVALTGRPLTKAAGKCSAESSDNFCEVTGLLYSHKVSKAAAAKSVINIKEMVFGTSLFAILIRILK